MNGLNEGDRDLLKRLMRENAQEVTGAIRGLTEELKHHRTARPTPPGPSFK